MNFCCLLIVSKSFFSENSYKNTISVSNSLDPNQDLHSFGPDLGPNCLQRLSADGTSRQRVDRVFRVNTTMLLWVQDADCNNPI